MYIMYVHTESHRFEIICLRKLVLNVWRVEAVLIWRGMLFQTMAPEYWKLFLKSSFLCVGIHIFWFVEDRNPYDAPVWKVNISDKYSGHMSWTVLCICWKLARTCCFIGAAITVPFSVCPLAVTRAGNSSLLQFFQLFGPDQSVRGALRRQLIVWTFSRLWGRDISRHPLGPYVFREGPNMHKQYYMEIMKKKNLTYT